MKKKNRQPEKRRPRHGKGKRRPIHPLPDIDAKVILGAFVGAMIAQGKISISFDPIDDKSENKVGTDPDANPPL